jgi:hypothetical protein
MSEPTEGRIVIEWKLISGEYRSGSAEDFDWKVSLEPPGLSDEQVERLLREVADRF